MLLSTKDKEGMLRHPLTHDVEWPTSKVSALAMSYSKLALFAECPFKYAAKHIYKTVGEESNPHFERGRAVHKSFENILKGLPVSQNGGLTVTEFRQYLPYAMALKAKEARLKESGKLVTPMFSERRMACTASHNKTGYFSKNVFMRGQADCGLATTNTLFVWDIKTGKGSGINDDQLELMALMALAESDIVPDTAKQAKCSFLLVDQDDTVDSKMPLSEIESKWRKWIGRSLVVVDAYEQDNFLPNPSPRACTWCPVKECKVRYERR